MQGTGPGGDDSVPLPPGDGFDEFAMVRVRSAAMTERGALPVGARGAIVAIWKGGVAFEVEFTEPFVGVVTLERQTIEPDGIRKAKPGERIR